MTSKLIANHAVSIQVDIRTDFFFFAIVLGVSSFRIVIGSGIVLLPLLPAVPSFSTLDFDNNGSVPFTDDGNIDRERMLELWALRLASLSWMEARMAIEPFEQ